MESKSPTLEGSSEDKSLEKGAFLKIIAKNFLAVPAIAKDMNIIRQNIVKILKIKGGKAITSADSSFAKYEEKEKKVGEELKKYAPEKEVGETKPAPSKVKSPKTGILQTFKNILNPKTFISLLTKIALPVLIITVIWDSIKDGIMEWFGENNIWKSIKENVGEFVEYITMGFIDKKMMENFFGRVEEFFKPVAEAVGKMFDDFSKWFSENLTVPIQKFLGINQVSVAAPPQPAPTVPLKPLEPLPSDDRLAKLEEERLAKEEALETERVRKLEAEKRYTGSDEIVRKRLGLPPKTETMKREEAAKEVKPPGALVSGTGQVVRSGTGEAVRSGIAPGPTIFPGVPAPTPAPAPTPTPAPAPKKGEKPVEETGVKGVIVNALKENGINSPKAHANVLATVKAESNFKPQSENLYYSSAEQIQKTFGKNRIPTLEFAQQFVKNPEALANYVYKSTDGNSAPGDGFKYRGRGFIQHTGKNQYAAISKFTGIDVLSNPDALNSPEVAAKAIPWFLLSYKRLKPEDVENMSKVNKAIAFSDPTGQKGAARIASSEQIYASMSGSIGTEVSSTSTELASAQRQQQRPATPNVINAPVNNTQVAQTTNYPTKQASLQNVAMARAV